MADRKTLVQNVICAANMLVEVDKELFARNHYEETINHRLALYLQHHYDEYYVDVEYSLEATNLKRDCHGNRVRPDIVIHKRSVNKSGNLAIIEIKRYSNGRSDKHKIECYRNLGYDYGIMLKFQKDGCINFIKSKMYDFRRSEWGNLNS